jgi:hypothetical protein
VLTIERNEGGRKIEEKIERKTSGKRAAIVF